MPQRIAPAGAGLLLHIRALLPSLNEQEQKVGQYVLDHPDEVVHLAMNELAGRCDTSDTTVFRFCRKVIGGGYQEFKIRLAQELGSSQSATYPAFTPQDTLAEAVHKVATGNIKAIEDTLSVLDLPALQQAVDALLAARRVHVYGSGGAAVTALEFQYKLTRLGLLAVAQTDAQMQMISASMLSPADAVVGISHSGTSPDTLQALNIARRVGATLIAITNHPASPIAEMADVSLCTAAQEAMGHGYPLGARVAQVALIDMLYTGMSLKYHDGTEPGLAGRMRVVHRGSE
jgi:DNA-binding MurR/RpiR family transcriptional regulator